MKDFRLKIKPQRGVTYECYMGYTDRMGTRVRRGRRYAVLSEGLRDDYYMISISGKGFGIAVPKEKFVSHFIPVNPLECCDE
jgi:hypothetical protein